MCSSSCPCSLKKPLNANLARDNLNFAVYLDRSRLLIKFKLSNMKVNHVPDSKTHDECSDDLDHAEPLLVTKKTDRLGTLLSHVPERLCHTMQQISRLIVLSRKFEESEVGF